MSAPKPPDPMKTAQAQGQMNKETAITQYGLGATNQITPWGNLTYKQIGTWPDGTPRYQATTKFSDENQALFDRYTGLASRMGDIGLTQADAVSGTLGQPFKVGNEQTEARLMELGRKRLDPMFQERKQSLDAELVNRGLRPGTEAYDREMGRFEDSQNDAYNQLLLSGRSQAAQESLTERNQPLNELMALLGGTQVQQPQFQSTPQPGVANVDYTGLVNQQYQAKLANHQGMMGGLFGLGSSLLGGLFGLSDRRAKTDIEEVGELYNGLPVYSFKYKGSPKTEIGLMAQEVEKVHPEAVAEHPSGLKMVNYEEAVQ